MLLNTLSPKSLSPRQSDLRVVFRDKASPKAAASATPNACPDASSSDKEVLSASAVEKVRASVGPNFLVPRMHIVLACRAVEVAVTVVLWLVSSVGG